MAFFFRNNKSANDTRNSRLEDTPLNLYFAIFLDLFIPLEAKKIGFTKKRRTKEQRGSVILPTTLVIMTILGTWPNQLRYLSLL